MVGFVMFFFLFFKQKTAYELRISDWSSDVCSSDLRIAVPSGWPGQPRALPAKGWRIGRTTGKISAIARATETHPHPTLPFKGRAFQAHAVGIPPDLGRNRPGNGHHSTGATKRSEEHTSELQSLMRISYAVFCLK